MAALPSWRYSWGKSNSTPLPDGEQPPADYAMYEIDATIGDVYLVSRFDRNKIIGRPVVYIVIDVFSRMITGVYIGLEGPSWVGAMMALANATAPKVEYCLGCSRHHIDGRSYIARCEAHSHRHDRPCQHQDIDEGLLGRWPALRSECRLMRAYVVNQLIQWEDDGRTERVLWLHPGGEGMFTIDIFEAKALPMFRNAASIEAHERSGALRVLDKDPWLRAVDELSLPQKQR
jgi:hypothetical protein